MMNTVWDVIFNNFIGFLLVLCRVTGIFSFNPIFSRSNVPNRIKAGMSVALAAVMTPMLGEAAAPPEIYGMLAFGLAVLKELFVGAVFGFFTNLLLTTLVYAGEIIDTQTGLGMAKTMDPATGINMPVFANIYYYLFILYFFITNGHLSYIRLFAVSYETIPIGYDFNDTTVNLARVIVYYMGTVMTLAVKFALPIIAAEIITEFCVGLMMKAIPTIQVFVVNIQLKLIIGFIVIAAAARPMSEMIEKILGKLWENLYLAAENFT